MAAGHSISYAARLENRSPLNSMHQATSRFLSAPQLPQQPSQQDIRDPNRIMSDPVESRRAKSPWTSTRMPNRTKMPNQLLHIPVPQVLSPRFAMKRTGRKKFLQKNPPQRHKGARSRLSSRSKRRSPSPPPRRLPIEIRETCSDESEMTKSALQLLPQLSKKQPSPARSYKAITANKVAPTTTGARKPRFSRQCVSHDHQRGAKTLERHTNVSSSPSREAFSQPSRHISRQRKCPQDSIRSAYDNRNDVLLPDLPFAPRSNVVCRNIPAIKPTAVISACVLDQELDPLCSSDREELHPRAKDKMTLQVSSLGSGAHNLVTSGVCSEVGSRSPRNLGAPVQRAGLSAETRRNHPRLAADVRRTFSSVSRTSVISDCSGGSLISGETASSGNATRSTFVILCLATAAVLSFLAFYAITDAALSDHTSTDHRGDPMTVRPDNEREPGYASKLRVYKHGPLLEGKKAQYLSSTPPSNNAPSSRGNSSNDGNVTDALEFTFKADNKT